MSYLGNRTGQPKHIRIGSKSRKCFKCRKRLTRYNLNELCFACQNTVRQRAAQNLDEYIIKKRRIKELTSK